MTDGGAGIDDAATFSVATGLEITEVPDGAMIYQAARDRVHYLNPTAVIVLELCTLGKSRAEMEAFIRDGFALERPPRAEIGSCLDALLGEGLVALD